jgi:hypothetical protein
MPISSLLIALFSLVGLSLAKISPMQCITAGMCALVPLGRSLIIFSSNTLKPLQGALSSFSWRKHWFINRPVEGLLNPQQLSYLLQTAEIFDRRATRSAFLGDSRSGALLAMELILSDVDDDLAASQNITLLECAREKTHTRRAAMSAPAPRCSLACYVLKSSDEKAPLCSVLLALLHRATTNYTTT